MSKKCEHRSFNYVKNFLHNRFIIERDFNWRDLAIACCFISLDKDSSSDLWDTLVDLPGISKTVGKEWIDASWILDCACFIFGALFDIVKRVDDCGDVILELWWSVVLENLRRKPVLSEHFPWASI